MNRLSRDFTLKEKILLLVLAIILIVLFYYYAVDQPVRRDLYTATTEAQDLEIQETMLTAQLTKVKAMSEELGEAKSAPAMPSYNAVKSEIAFLNDVMENAETYSMDFADVTREGNQIRRDVSLTFTAADYATAEEIIRAISNCQYRCLLGDIQVKSDNDERTEDLGVGGVSVYLTMTYYETMVGGTPDDGLPEEESEQENSDADKIDEYLDEYSENYGYGS